jgi:uncharacterized protein YndB with AHSA1/START domain
MATAQSEVHIRRSIQEVFAFVADPSTHPRWQDDLETDRLEVGTGDVGTVGTEVRRFMGKTVTTRYRVIDCQAPTRWVVRTIDGPVKATSALELSPAASGTDVRFHMEFEGWAAGVMARHSHKQLANHLHQLKAILEG